MIVGLIENGDSYKNVVVKTILMTGDLPYNHFHVKKMLLDNKKEGHRKSKTTFSNNFIMMEINIIFIGF